MEKLKPIVVGNSDFEDLIRSGSLYVDKTEGLCNLITNRGSESLFF